MNKTFLQAIRPMLIMFVALTAFFITGKNWLIKQGINHEVLIIGNLVIAFATLASLWVLLKAGASANPQSFVRSMYGSFMIRFFVILITAFIYIMTARKNVNKPAIIGCAAVYMAYSFIEISILLKLMKRKKDA